MADPGFPEEGAPTPKVGVFNLLIYNFFCRKLHENSNN